MSNTRTAAAAICAIAASLGFTATAGATPPAGQLDQSSASAANIRLGFVSQAHRATASQTFTAGMSGELTDVTVQVSQDFGFSGNLRMAINPVDGGGNPDTATELAVQSVPFSSLSSGAPAAVDFAFSTPAPLVAGVQYAITLSETDGVHEHIWWAGSSGDTYAGGTASGTRFSSGDLAFETYMLAAGGRAGYCSVAGNTWDDGTPIPVGTFLNLDDGQNAAGQFGGATVAYFLEGLGISCDVPAGYAPTGELVGFYGHGDTGGPYRYYSKNR